MAVQWFKAIISMFHEMHLTTTSLIRLNTYRLFSYQSILMRPDGFHSKSMIIVFIVIESCGINFDGDHFQTFH